MVLDEEINELFTSVKKLKELTPWKDLKDTDVFAIKIPRVKDIYLCSILGYNNIVYGMSIYKGIDGIESYFKVINKDYDTEEEALNVMEGVAIYFEDRTELEKKDYDLVKSSGISFRGKKSWPYFRNYKPGYLSKMLDRSQYKKLTLILKYAIETIKEVRNEKEKISLINSGKLYLRKYNSKGEFTESIVKYKDLYNESINSIEIPEAYNELALIRIRKEAEKTNDIWELDTFYHCSYINDIEPYFPIIMFLVNTSDDSIVACHLTQLDNCYVEFQKYIIGTLMVNKVLPRKIRISNKKLFINMISMFEILGVEVEIANKLELMPDIKKDFFLSMRKDEDR